MRHAVEAPIECALAACRQRLAGYLAAIAINVGLLTGLPSTSRPSLVYPQVQVRSQPLVDGCWDPREMVTGGRRILVTEDDGHPQPRTEWLSAN